MSPAIVNGNGIKKPHLDGFGTRAIHVGSEPDEETGAVIPAISLSTTYKQSGVGVHKVSPSFEFQSGRITVSSIAIVVQS
jgi:cystathionine gamma-lyase